jgi:predicted PurR-regulated permease PerM
MKLNIKIPIGLIVLHSTLVWLAYFAIQTSQDSETVMIWWLIGIIDFPSSYFLFPMSGGEEISIPIKFTILGVFHWGIVGFIISILIKRFSKSKSNIKS